MSAHRTKRPYSGGASLADRSQLSITTFFHTDNSERRRTADLPSATESQASSSSQPELPAHVQANLLSVGMRVRKSVPEGYKTQCTSPFPLAADPFLSVSPAPAPLFPGSQRQHHEVEAPLPSPPRHRPRRGAMVVLPSEPRPVSPAIATAAGTAPRELEPFCGLHRVGGLAVQPTSLAGAVNSYQPHHLLVQSTHSPCSSDSYALLDDSDFAIASANDGESSGPPSLHDVPSLLTPSSSQESTSSSGSEELTSPQNAVWWRNHATSMGQGPIIYRPQSSRKRAYRDDEEDEPMAFGSGGFRTPNSTPDRSFEIYTTNAAAESRQASGETDGDVSPRTLGPAAGTPVGDGTGAGGSTVFGEVAAAHQVQNRILAVPRGSRHNNNYLLYSRRSKHMPGGSSISQSAGPPLSPLSPGSVSWEKQMQVNRDLGQENAVLVASSPDSMDLGIEGTGPSAGGGSVLPVRSGSSAAADDDFPEATFLDNRAWTSVAGEDMEMSEA